MSMDESSIELTSTLSVLFDDINKGQKAINSKYQGDL